MERSNPESEIPRSLLLCVQPELEVGFSDPNKQFALVGRSGCVYLFGGVDDRAEAERQRALTEGTLDEDLFIIDRPETTI